MEGVRVEEGSRLRGGGRADREGLRGEGWRGKSSRKGERTENTMTSIHRLHIISNEE